MHGTSYDDDPRGVDLLVSPVRRALVDVLAAHRPDPDDLPGLTAAQLATELELHVSTVRFHVDQLVAAGLLEAEFTARFGVGRPRKIYRVAPGSLSEERDAEALKKLTALLVGTFTSGVTPEEAGRRWAQDNVPHVEGPGASTPGEWLGKVGRMVDVLEEWGYTPELTTSRGGRTTTVDLHHCPFLDLARSSPAVVCGVHRGIIVGALGQLGEEAVDVSLQPFVGPALCQAHITTRMPFRGRDRSPEGTPRPSHPTHHTIPNSV
ncbi:helix-turn-helix transcriptional regulator [Nocardioides gilvus]|uniref:helix-turn-helix transcriptional regulator n=1 Tax=Nocardioides gilvus TaxID=1735589 RepID=UPI000D74A123|nr:helix-turn-helix domain-containing protein [Nocardioides gilvus]